MTGFSCIIDFNFVESGFGIVDKHGWGISNATNANMQMNFSLSFQQGQLQISVSPANLKVIASSITTTSNTTTSVGKAIGTAMAGYLNSVQFAGVIPSQLSAYLQSYLNNEKYIVNTTIKNLYMNSQLIDPGFQITSNYTSYYSNGTILANNMPGPANIDPPTELPSRVSTATSANESQVIISKYTLYTYFDA